MINQNNRLKMFIINPFENFQTQMSSRVAMAITKLFLLKIINYKCGNLEPLVYLSEFSSSHGIESSSIWQQKRAEFALFNDQ